MEESPHFDPLRAEASSVSPAPVISETGVNEILNGIIDPCSVAAGLPAGLVDLGLVRMIEITAIDSQLSNVRIQIGTTDPRCMMAAVFMNEIRQRFAGLPGLAELTIELDHRTIWTPALMQQEYRDRLEAHRKKY